jgi:hypothetical protein
MEALTRLVTDSLARHGFDRPIDPRRLQWSRWFRCDSPHSLLVVPSKPGIFAIAEEIMDLGTTTAHVGTDAFVRPAEQSSATASAVPTLAASTVREGHDFSRAVRPSKMHPRFSARGEPLTRPAISSVTSSPPAHFSPATTARSQPGARLTESLELARASCLPSERSPNI